MGGFSAPSPLWETLKLNYPEVVSRGYDLTDFQISGSWRGPLPSKHVSANRTDTQLPSRSHLSGPGMQDATWRLLRGIARLTATATAAPGVARLPRAKFPKKNRVSLKFVAQEQTSEICTLSSWRAAGRSP